MGKGDKKTRKGKISMGTYGVSRPKKSENSETSTSKKSKSDKKEKKK